MVSVHVCGETRHVRKCISTLCRCAFRFQEFIIHLATNKHFLPSVRLSNHYLFDNSFYILNPLSWRFEDMHPIFLLESLLGMRLQCIAAAPHSQWDRPDILIETSLQLVNERFYSPNWNFFISIDHPFPKKIHTTHLRTSIHNSKKIKNTTHKSAKLT